MFMPFQVLGMWIRGLLALVFVGLGIFLLVLWYGNRERTIIEPVAEAPSTELRTGPQRVEPAPDDVEETHVRTIYWQFGLNKETAYLLVL